jgi:fucose permease
LALFTIPYSKVYIIALTLYVMLGVGLAFFEASSNPLISIMYFQRKAFALNLLHFFWGFGCFLGPLIASRVILRFESWRPAYLISALIFIPLLIYSITIKNKIKRIEDDKETIIQKKGKSIFSKELILLGVSSFFFFGAELGPNAWLIPFLMTERDFSFSLASITLSIFWVFVAIGRLLFRGAPDRLGYWRSMILFSIATGVSLLLGVVLQPTYVVMSFWALSGLCFAPILPTLLAWANQIFPERGGVASGTIFSLGVLGAVFSPWFIGVISESIGLKNGITFLALSAFLILTGIISLKGKFESRSKL